MAVGAVGMKVAAPSNKNSIQSDRRIKNQIWWGLCGVGLFLLVAPVLWILIGIIARAASKWNWGVLTHYTSTQNGLLNAIEGTFLLTLGVAIIAGIVGIGCGIYLAEVARPSVFTTILRSASEVLSGIPSIVFGYVGYVALVVYFHWGYSLLAALIVLSFLVVPYVAKSTELALSQVPLAYREGGEALGMHRTLMLRRVVMRSAIPGIATGLIIALAISVGETAPLLYTANWSDHAPTLNLLHAPVPYLTYAAYTFYNQPLPSLQALASDASALLLVLVLLLILAARLVVRVSQKYSPNAPSVAGRGIKRKSKADATVAAATGQA